MKASLPMFPGKRAHRFFVTMFPAREKTQINMTVPAVLGPTIRSCGDTNILSALLDYPSHQENGLAIPAPTGRLIFIGASKECLGVLAVALHVHQNFRSSRGQCRTAL